MTKTLTKIHSASRRTFLKASAAVGGGLAVGIHFPVLAQTAAAPGTAELGIWVLVQPDDTVVIRYARAEMGQGSMTSAPMLVAEELECDWNKVRVEYVTGNQQIRRKRAWGSMSSAGSQTIRQSQEYLRKGGATAREMLVAAAAQEWKVPASECTAANSVITHAASGRKVSFGHVAEAAAKIDPPKDVKLKDPKDWKLVGKSMPRFDIPTTVAGKQRYGIDTQLPGMVYATVAQCPVFGGKVKSVDASKVKGRRGIIEVQNNGSFVAVVADNWWRAKEALKLVTIEWDEGANSKASSATIMAMFKAGLDATDAAVAKREGDVVKAFASAAKVLEAEYFTPYVAHSPLEPMGCTVLMKDDKVDVWVSTQNAEANLVAVATAAGVPQENVEVHRMQAGGGFGRRIGDQDVVRQGVAIAKELGKTRPGVPVKMLWTREEDTQHDYYRPASLVRIKGGLDAAGKPVAYSVRVSAPSITATLTGQPLNNGIDNQAVVNLADYPYVIPNVLVDYAQRNGHVPVGFWRTVGSSQNPFVRECFIDELAHAAGKDPLEYRRSIMAPARTRDLGILEAVAKHVGWDKPAPKGVFRGIAEADAYGSHIASVVEVSAVKDVITIHRVVVGIDCGYVVNPDNIRAQIEGSVVFGLSAILWGENTIKDGRVEQSNFHDYRMMRLSEMPKTEVVIAPSGGFWGGVGEPANAPVAPALGNAIFAATGKRLRSLPLKHHGLTFRKA